MMAPKIGPPPREEPAAKRDDPTPHGDNAAPLHVAITRAQRAALRARADAQGCTVSELVGRFIADGLAAPVPAKSDDADR
jgi:hypothetical protein